MKRIWENAVRTGLFALAFGASALTCLTGCDSPYASSGIKTSPAYIQAKKEAEEKAIILNSLEKLIKNINESKAAPSYTGTNSRGDKVMEAYHFLLNCNGNEIPISVGLEKRKDDFYHIKFSLGETSVLITSSKDPNQNSCEIDFRRYPINRLNDTDSKNKARAAGMHVLKNLIEAQQQTNSSLKQISFADYTDEWMISTEELLEEDSSMTSGELRRREQKAKETINNF